MKILEEQKEKNLEVDGNIRASDMGAHRKSKKRVQKGDSDSDKEKVCKRE